MKKLMLVVVLLAFVASTWGITAVADVNDEAYISLTVCMVGIEFQIYDDGATFLQRGSLDDGYTYVSDVSSPEIMHGSMTGACMQPCAKNNIVFGLENTGGITIDISAYEGTYVMGGAGTTIDEWESEAGAVPDNFECAGLAVGDYKILTGGLFPSLGNAGLHVFPTAWHNQNGVTAAIADEIISNLVAEDAAVPGDGAWTATQDDVADVFVGLVAPPTVRSVVSADGPHTIEIVYLATVAAP